MSLFDRRDQAQSASRRGALPAALLLSVAGARDWKRRHNIRRMRRGLRRFTPLPELATYEESQPRMAATFARVPHAVLLLHGYSASPYEFKHLIQGLDREGIPYHAPLLTGHGLSNFRLLYQVTAEDWLRDAVQAYNLLAALADEISVLGHSTGATLAVYLAQHRPVRSLILSAPNLFAAPSDRRAKARLNTPVLSTLTTALLPVFAKPVRPGRAISSDTLDETEARLGFSYAALPTRSLLAQWDLQDRVDISQARCRDLTLVYGEQDLTVDISTLRALLDARGIDYTAHAFARSAHNVLMDFDREASVGAIVKALRGEPERSEPSLRSTGDGWQAPRDSDELPLDGVHIYRASLERRDDASLATLLSEDELRRATRLRFERDRRRSIIARGLLRLLLGRHARLAAESLRFSYGANGKPALADPVEGRVLSFNLAHSHDLAVFALAWDRALGIDIERIRPLADAEQIASRFFSAAEAAALNTLPAEARHEAFFHCWVRKEAYLKGTGNGLRTPLAGFDVSLLPGEPARLLRVACGEAERIRWHLHAFHPTPGYAGAIAMEGSDREPAYWDLGADWRG